MVALDALQAVLAHLEEGERQADDRVGEFVQGLEAQAVAQQRVDDLGETVVPLERDGVLRLGLRVGVVAGLVEALRPGTRRAGPGQSSSTLYATARIRPMVSPFSPAVVVSLTE